MPAFNLPPGCRICDLPGYYDYPCAVCGKDLDDCICPECPVCGQVGDPGCYDNHGLVRTQEQVTSFNKAEAKFAENPYIPGDNNDQTD